MQTMYALVAGDLHSLSMPAPDVALLPRLTWGPFDGLLTPAYWRGQAWQEKLLGSYAQLKLGRNLTEEVAACLLGGYGMTAEMGLSAYRRVRDEGLLNADTPVEAFEASLRQPIVIGETSRSYRFPAQKARYLAGCCQRLDGFGEPESDRALRDQLATLPGVGLKTASWVVRNYRQSDQVAVLDVHILRAGRAMELFPARWTAQNHYRQLEALFLAFAAAIDTPADFLDALMWDYMRRMPSFKVPATAAQRTRSA